MLLLLHIAGRVSESLGEVEGGGIQRGEGPEKEKWMRRRERKERRDSERRGSINTSDSDSGEALDGHEEWHVAQGLK